MRYTYFEKHEHQTTGAGALGTHQGCEQVSFGTFLQNANAGLAWFGLDMHLQAAAHLFNTGKAVSQALTGDTSKGINDTSMRFSTELCMMHLVTTFRLLPEANVIGSPTLNEEGAKHPKA